MSLGPVMFDLQGLELSAAEIDLLQHPAAGGIILFARNYRDKGQLKKLTQSIRQHRPDILIAVDQEGGRVQRFRRDFTELPAARKFGEAYDQDPQTAKIYAETAGWVMAAELRQYDIDFSFAPVLDLDFDNNDVIGDRAFHRNPEVVAELAGYFIRGMNRAGMQAVGKHFPGHGFVGADSHFELPIDKRSKRQLNNKDIVPFARLIQQGLLAGVMPAYVIYQQIDKDPAGFSSYWLKDVLRKKYGFKGAVFSDSLTMEGAEFAGGFDERAIKAFEAGCDMVVVCNNRLASITMLKALKDFSHPGLAKSLSKMRGQVTEDLLNLEDDPAWQEGVALLEMI